MKDEIFHSLPFNIHNSSFIIHTSLAIRLISRFD